MIERRVGDMLEEATSGFMVHGCNCQGAMGSGIAKLIRDKWPPVYEKYSAEHDEYGLTLGEVVPVFADPGLLILNAMTQEFYQGHPSDPYNSRYVSYDAIERAFNKINTLSIALPEVDPVLHFPLIGAGLAKGNWNIIETIIDETVTDMKKVLWTLPE